MRILVVDDDPIAGELTGAILEGLGHEVVLAEDGADALGRLEADGGIGLVFSDLNMPVMSGIDLFRELLDEGRTVPFVLLTGDEPSRSLAEEPRLDACLVKDENLEESLQRVIAQLSGRGGPEGAAGR